MKFFVYWVFEWFNPQRGYVGGAYGTGEDRPKKHIDGTCTCAPGCILLSRPVDWEFLMGCETWEETRRMEMVCEREMRLAGYEVINHVFSFSEEAQKKGHAIRVAAGHPELKKAQAVNAAAGYPNLKKGRATMAAGGWKSLKEYRDKGRATMAALGYPNLKKGLATLAAKRKTQNDVIRKQVFP